MANTIKIVIILVNVNVNTNALTLTSVKCSSNRKKSNSGKLFTCLKNISPFKNLINFERL